MRLRGALAIVLVALLAGGSAAYGQPVAGPQIRSAPDQPGAPPNDPFGEEVMLPERTILFFKGSGLWDSAFEAIIDAFKSLNGFMERQGIKPAGHRMIIYMATDDAGFQFHAAVPIAEAPSTPPRGDLAVGKSPVGRALKFIHRGSYDSMDSTYEAITNFLDEKQLDAGDLFIEEYVTDPLATPEDKLVIEVYVPIR